MSVPTLVTPRPFLWVAYPTVAGGWTRVIERALSLGFGGVAPRAGEGLANGTVRSSLSPKVVTAIRDAGLECLPWIYSRPQAIAAQTACYQQLVDAGATAVIDDAEAPWDADPKAGEHALAYGELMTAAISVPIYDAPWPMIAWHPGYPEAEFRQWVSGRMTQAYWTEIGRSARATMDLMRAQWSGRDDRLLPIGITYGRREIAKLGAKQLPPREISVVEVREVAAEVLGGWYTIEAAGDGVLEAIADEMRTAAGTPAGPPTQPETTAEPIGWQDRAEAAAEDDGCSTFYCRNRDVHDGYEGR